MGGPHPPISISIIEIGVYKMKPVDIASGAQRNVNAGMLWVEMYNGAGPSPDMDLYVQQTFRVSAGAGDAAVYIDGVLAMTLRQGEVEYFNVGSGLSTNNKTRVRVSVTGPSRVQVAQQSDYPYRPHV